MTETKNVEKVKNRRRGTGVGAPGQLDRYDDGSWEFFGNDETTPEEVAQKIIDYERQARNEDYNKLRAGPLAQMLLDTPDNAALSKAGVRSVLRPIPKGKSMVAEAPTLAGVVKLLLQHENALREQLVRQQSEPRATQKALGTLAGGGLTLPYEP